MTSFHTTIKLYNLRVILLVVTRRDYRIRKTDFFFTIINHSHKNRYLRCLRNDIKAAFPFFSATSSSFRRKPQKHLLVALYRTYRLMNHTMASASINGNSAYPTHKATER